MTVALRSRPCPSLLAACVLVIATTGCRTPSRQNGAPGSEPPIDRHALVTRHNPIVHSGDRRYPLSLGNGEFGFTADITGLQTFPAEVPLLTQSQWGWHTFPNPHAYTPPNAYEPYDTYGRTVDYASRERTDAGVWLRENPQRLNLAQIGLALTRADGSAAGYEDLS